MRHYIYVYLDPRKPGDYKFDDLMLEFEPFYLGVSKNENRKDSHLKDAKFFIKNGFTKKSGRNGRKVFKIAKILNDGFEPIVKILFDELESASAYNLEKELVSKIGRKHLNEGPLLNYLPGGQIIDGDVIAIQLNKSITHNKDKRRPLLQLSLEGNILREWDSVISAKDELGINHIDACCRGTRKSAGGFVWRYVEDQIIDRSKYKARKTNNVKNRKHVEQLTVDGIKVNEFDSAFQAAKQTGISRSNISNAVTGFSKTAGGFVWKYKNKN